MVLGHRFSVRAIAIIIAAAVIAALAVVAAPGILSARASAVSQTFAYSTSAQTFTVPSGITLLDITMLGGEGGLGGTDSTGPTQGGYRGKVTGTLAVTPGQVLTIGVGGAGQSGLQRQADVGTTLALGGTNPIGGYTGGTGGLAGDQGSSGNGAGGGAATVIKAGSTTIVAGGAGGGGGSGQYPKLTGRPSEPNFSARPDTVSTIGRDGISTGTVCTASIRCDGGASGAGGGGAIGGDQGAVAYGAGSDTEYFGYGGYPGANDVTGLVTGSAVYEYYPLDGLNGSVTISYDQSAPDAPTAVAGTADDGAIDVAWLAPLGSGGSVITDYKVQYAVASATPTWIDVNDGTSSATSTTVGGLTNGTAYEFRVAAINSFGTGSYSTPSANVTPSAVPGAPTLTSVTPSAASLAVAFTPASSDSPVTRYEYRLGSGSWVAAGTSSPFAITGLTDGTSYSVTLRAVSAIGAGAASNSLSATPVSTPGAPSIRSITPAVGAASVAFTAGYAGGKDITDYEYRLGSGDWVSTHSTSSPFTLSGLDDGTTYSLSLRAISDAGAGTASGASSFTTPATPGAPTLTSITPGDESASIKYTPGATGGLDITGYQYQLTSGGNWIDAPSATSPLVITGLTNGTSYDVRLRAINAVGSGSASSPSSTTPATVPGAPALVGDTIAGSDRELDAAFTAPASDGGAPITHYEYSTDSGVSWRIRATGTTESPVVITTLSSDGTTPLTNGTTYLVEVRAVNSVGAGTDSGVAAGIARTIPDAPTLTAVHSLPAGLRVDFQPASNGGSPLTSYEYRLGSGTWKNTGTLGSEFVIDGLDNGTSYSVELRAVNAVGNGPASAAMSGTPASVPGVATITAVTPGDRALSVGVSLDTTGGSAVTSWEYSTDGGTTWTAASGSSSPLTIGTLSTNGTTRLTNGTAYPIAVRAINAVGTGAVSATRLVAPVATPDAPTTSLTPQDGSILVTYTQGDNGGGSVSDIQYRVNGGDWVSAGSLGSSFVIGSLTNGTSYAVQVRAVNSAGGGAASATASATPRTIPDAPDQVTASPDGSQATVSWAAPANNGSAIDGYVAIAWSASSGGTAVKSCSTTGLSCIITGLTNGTVYYVSVNAHNAAGDGSASAPRVAVTPLAKPGAPTITGITAANTFAKVAFTAGTAGSSSITGYQYSLNSGAWVSAGSTSSPITISGLDNGTSYSVVLRAVNASGAGASSNAVSVTPFATPEIPDPSKIIATPGNGSAVISWTAPDNNGSAITDYGVVLWSAAAQGTQSKVCDAGAALTCTLTGLTNGVTYYVTVDATNGGGTTIRSDPRVPVTPGAPGAVASLTGTPGNAKVNLSWAAGGAGNTAVSDYTIWYAPVGSSTFTQFSDGVSTGTSASVTSLTNGTNYTFKVYAVNSFGTGQSSSVAATPVAPGTVPTFDAAAGDGTGFTAKIHNYDAGTTYTVATNHGSATVSGDTVTVTGLAAGQSAIATVTANLIGHATTTGQVSGTALLAGTAPILDAPLSAVNGFTVTIANHSDSVTYTATATSGTATVDGSTVTVSGLAPGATATVTVVASRSGYSDAQAQVVGSVLNAGTDPDLALASRTADGFTIDIGNLDSDATYTVSSTNPNATVEATGSTVIVTGLAPGESATVTVAVLAPGDAPASSSIAAEALLAGTAPELGTPVPTADGFTTAIENVDPDGSYAVQVDHGTAAIAGDTVTVSGLEPGQSAEITVTVSVTGHTAESDSATGAALLAGTAPELEAPISTETGYTVDITDFSGALDYVVSATNGAANLHGSTVTVFGLDAGEASTLTVTAKRSGYTDASAHVDGSALRLGIVPDLSVTARGAAGYTIDITNFDDDVTYLVGSSNSNASLRTSGHTVIVSGLAAGESAKVTVQVKADGAAAASSSVTSSALETGDQPQFTPPASTVDGFTFTIANYADGTGYDVSVSNGDATIDGDTVTVTGLTPGQSSTATVTATLAGHTTTEGTATGSALHTGTTPQFDSTHSTETGYTVNISNFSDAVTYSVSASNGGAATISGSTVTVVGMDAGATSTLTVVATRAGYTDASGEVTGAALNAGTIPVVAVGDRTDDGFTLVVGNLDGDASYTLSSTNPHAILHRSGSTITVSGLALGESATVTIEVKADGDASAGIAITSSALDEGLTPQLGAPVATNDGFTVSLLNHSDDFSYSYSATGGATVAVSGNEITVSGLDAAQGSTLTVVSERTGYTTKSATVDGVSLGAGADLTASAVVRASGGYSVTLPGFDDDYAYSATSTFGVATIVDGVVTVTGLTPGQSATVTIVATRAGERTITADVTGAALATGTPILLSAATPRDGGFTAKITSFAVGTAYTATTSRGQVKLTGDRIAVKGLADSGSAVVTVTAKLAGFTDALASVGGKALAAPIVPVVPVNPEDPATDDSTAPVAPDAVEVTPGSGQVQTGSDVTPSTISTSKSGVTLKSGDVTMAITSIVASKGSASTVSDHLVIEEGSALRVSVSGFRSGTPVTVWVFSTPVQVAQTIVADDLSASSDFVLPAQIAPGNHTLVATGTAASGKTVTLRIGFVVSADAASAAGENGSGAATTGSGKTGSGYTTSRVASASAAEQAQIESGLWWIGGVLAALLAGFFLIVAWRRRRRDDEDDQPRVSYLR